MRNILLIILVVFYVPVLQAQDADFIRLQKTEEMLKSSFEQLYAMEEGQERDTLNDFILKTFEAALSTWDGFHYSWTELDQIGKVKSDDGKLKVFTWYLEFQPGEYKYYGLVQYLLGNKRKQEVKLYSLKDHSAEIEQPEQAKLDTANWFGVLYYGMATFNYKRDNYYTLFGFDFNNPHSRKKLVDVFRINKKGELQIGGDFLINDKVQERFIIEYSAEIVANLRYDKRLNMIVFDHLAPLQPFFRGNYRFYSPDGSFDALTFEKGSFFLKEDIDARNQ